MTRIGAAMALCIALVASGCVFIAPVSVGSTGTTVGATPTGIDISGDGTFVVFTTTAALDPVDTNGVEDVYLTNTVTEATQLVSIGLGGSAANAASLEPSVSADGTRVGFVSSATNLTTAPTGGHQQVYVHTVSTGETVLASVGTGGFGNGASSEAILSDDGLVVVFTSRADNLVPGDTNGARDVFSHTLSTASTQRRSVGAGGTESNGPSFQPAVNHTGTVVAFASSADNLVAGDTNGVDDVFWNAAGTTTSVSGTTADGASSHPDIAATAGDITFTSLASNLVAGDTNGVADVFMKPSGSALERISHEPDGTSYTGASGRPKISASGTRVLFETAGANVAAAPSTVGVLLDRDAATLDIVTSSGTGASVADPTDLALAPGGAYVAFTTAVALDADDTNAGADVYVRFTHPARVTWRSVSPPVVEVGATLTITVAGEGFSPDAAPTLSVLGGAGSSISNVTVLDPHTLAATLTVDPNATTGTFNVLVETPGGPPGSAPSSRAGATTLCACLTVVDEIPAPGDFVDIAPAIGLSGPDTPSIGVHVADIDDDADQDVLLIRHTNTPEELLTNTGGLLDPQPFGSVVDRHYCASADVDADGALDLYCSVGAGTGSGVGDNNLYLGQSDGTFVDEAAAWGVTDPLGRGRQVAFLHANNDALPDLFVANWSPRSDGQPSSNRLFLNTGTSFVPAPGFGVDEETPTTCAVVADFDTDGDDDLVVCAAEGLRMFANQGGTGFVDVAVANGFDYRAIDVAFGDIDLDGDLDMGVATFTLSRIYRLADGVDDGTVFSAPATSGTAVAAGDVNGDTRPDFYFAQKGCGSANEPNLPDTAAVSSGATYVTASLPQVSRGCGGDVVPFDHDGDGRSGFIVLHGAGRAGPVQYLTYP